MAQKVTRALVDDLDGSPAVATVRFGYDGRDYEIELSEAHAAELEEFLAPYREHARRVGGGGRADRRRPSRQPREDTQAIRQWAREQGYQVSDRGRIPSEVVAAYQAAYSGALTATDRLARVCAGATLPRSRTSATAAATVAMIRRVELGYGTLLPGWLIPDRWCQAVGK